MHLIDENVYLGDIQDARNSSLLQNIGIASMLTIDVEELPDEIKSTYSTKFVELEDTCEANLLDLLDASVSFIDEANNEGKVLVHCNAGVSRSASLVCAWLMKKKGIRLLEAEELLTKQKPDVAINQGFIRQLLIYESMGCKVDRDHPGYQVHKFRKLRALAESGKRLAPESLSANPSKIITGLMVYKCKKCRRPLFKRCNVNPHDIDESKMFRSKNPEVEGPVKCSSYFLEPIRWMESAIIDNVTGKLDCPTCGFKLGRFNWAGARCSCGQWITPALQIHVSNVDESIR